MPKIIPFKKEYCLKLFEYMKSGGSLVSFANTLGYSVTTIRSWLATYPELQEAYELGRIAYYKRHKEIKKSWSH